MDQFDSVQPDKKIKKTMVQQDDAYRHAGRIDPFLAHGEKWGNLDREAVHACVIACPPRATTHSEHGDRSSPTYNWLVSRTAHASLALCCMHRLQGINAKRSTICTDI
jgi:hypothetical protein